MGKSPQKVAKKVGRQAGAGAFYRSNFDMLASCGAVAGILSTSPKRSQNAGKMQAW
jgi:hypothetical protein